jgi:nicotinamide-nucleotide amidase
VTPELLHQAELLLARLRAASLKLATAESCTGGLVAATLTAIAGSSDVVERGFVTYSNEAKAELLGVPMAMIAEHGAVSRPVARAMVLGALSASRADVAISVTGVAGPGGGSAEKPVGLVFIGACRRGAEPEVARCLFPGDRAQVREASVQRAFDLAAALAQVAGQAPRA